jgi:glucokinase
VTGEIVAEFAIGIDLGGTKIAGALIDRAGQVLAQVRRPTQAHEGYAAVIERVVACIRELEAAAPGPVAGIGLGAPASVDTRRKVVIAAVNLGWYELPLGKLLIEHLGAAWADRLWIDKDVNGAALCEFLYGAGQGAGQLFYVGVGTGVGAAQVLDGRVYHGACGSDGNIGHLALNPEGDPCGCGKRGCVETVVSGPSIARRAAAALIRGEHGLLAALNPDSITAVQVVEAARAGDELACRILAEAGRYLGIALAYYVDLANPDRIVVGGGVMAAGNLLLNPIRETIREWALPANAGIAQVVPATFPDAGAIGAAAFVWHSIQD